MEILKRAIKTKYGVYKLKATKDVKDIYSREATKKEIGILLNLGGKDTNCIQIKVPYEESVGKILWIQSGKHNECSIDDKEQRGEKLIHMVHLGITIAKEINPSLQTLELEDSASFDCSLPDGKKIAMSATDHDIAFYQQSYYERRYGAILMNPIIQKEYDEDMKGFYDISKKPLLFDFKNKDIEDELVPLYDNSVTWKAFFDKINIKYGKNKCTVIVVWVKSALLRILKNKNYSGMEWIIDVNKIPTILYEERELVKSGGSTRKHKTYVKAPMLPEILEMDWKKYFSNHQ